MIGSDYIVFIHQIDIPRDRGKKQQHDWDYKNHNKVKVMQKTNQLVFCVSHKWCNVAGFEPTFRDLEAPVLPLNYTCIGVNVSLLTSDELSNGRIRTYNSLSQESFELTLGGRSGLEPGLAASSAIASAAVHDHQNTTYAH